MLKGVVLGNLASIVTGDQKFKQMIRLAVAFSAQRRISDPLFLFVLVWASVFPLLGNYILYHYSSAHGMTTPREIYPAALWSGSPTPFANLAMIGIIIGAVVIGFGRVPPRDLGISWRNVAFGISALPLSWCAFATTEAIMGSAGAGFASNPSWGSAAGVYGALGDWIGQIIGNAPYEELVFRAFLIPQIYLRWPARPVLVRLICAVVLSQAFFATAHIGTRVFKGQLSGIDLFVSLLWVFALGLAFAWIYLRTLNPFVAAAFHALSNYPEPIYYSARELFPNETRIAYLLAAVIFGALFPLFHRVFRTVVKRTSPSP